MITVFFESQDTQSNWLAKLYAATDNYNIQEFYQFNLKNILNQGRSGSKIIQGINKMSRTDVAIKIISKDNKSASKIEDVKDLIKMYEIA